MCANEPAECKNSNILTTSDCTTARISFYCPILCGKCEAVQPSTVAATAIQTSSLIMGTLTTTTGKSSCELFSCNNGGTFNMATCSCTCYPAYVA